LTALADVAVVTVTFKATEPVVTSAVVQARLTLTLIQLCITFISIHQTARIM